MHTLEEARSQMLEAIVPLPVEIVPLAEAAGRVLASEARALIDLIGTLVFLIPFSLVMLYVSWPVVSNSFSIREMSPDPGGLPRWPIKIVILVSFVLLMLQGLSQIVKQIDILGGGDDESGTTEGSSGPPPEAPA